MITKDTIKTIPTRDLVKTAKELESLIYGSHPCFSTSDIGYLSMIETEIDERRQLNGCPHYW